jgi:biotin carboxyl carrier protein
LKNIRAPRILNDGKVIWIHFEGRTYKASAEGEYSREKMPGTKNLNKVPGTVSGILKSPMPGKVLKVNFTVGAMVKAGETVCILEAMKMEYALKAPFDGKIGLVNKKDGELVGLDEIIVEVKK